jgi:hypothetical protein
LLLEFFLWRRVSIFVPELRVLIKGLQYRHILNEGLQSRIVLSESLQFGLVLKEGSIELVPIWIWCLWAMANVCKRNAMVVGVPRS